MRRTTGPCGRENAARDTLAVARPLSTVVVALLLVAASRSEAKYGGGAGTPKEPYRLYTAEHLRALAADVDDWDRHFLLMADVDMNDVSHAGWLPIGDTGIAFTGTFDGADRTISNFNCVCPGCRDVGLFGYVRSRHAEIRNVRLLDACVDAETGENAGALLGRLKDATVRNCRVERAGVRASVAAGGMVGWNEGIVIRCSFGGTVVGDYSIGGLVGLNGWYGQIRDCFADAHVTGISRVGGLVGGGIMSAVDWCAAAGRIEGRSNVGGLIGCSDGAITTNCYATASVMGNSSVGGLVGDHAPSCDCSPGLRQGEVHKCYSTGPVSGGDDTGGLIGLAGEFCLVEDCFWDLETSGLTTSAGGTGLATAQLHTPTPFIDADWDFTPNDESGEFWIIRSGPDYPRPAWQLLAGDLDDDGDIDLRDFSFLARRWGKHDATFLTGGTDLTDDGTIDGRDLRALCGRWLEHRAPRQR